MSETYDFDLVAIGSGPAGQRAAVQAAKLGKRAAVIEKNRCVGGVCVETGTIPSKTFREAVWAVSAASGPGARPTAQQLLARVSDVVRREIEVLDSQLRRNDVTVIRGEARFQDPHTLLVRIGGGGPDGARGVHRRRRRHAAGHPAGGGSRRRGRDHQRRHRRA